MPWWISVSYFVVTSQEEPLISFPSLNEKPSLVQNLSWRTNSVVTCYPSSHTSQASIWESCHEGGYMLCSFSLLSFLSWGSFSSGAFGPGKNRKEKRIGGHWFWWLTIPNYSPRHIIRLYFPFPLKFGGDMWHALADDMWAWIPEGWVEMDMENAQGIYSILIKC